jgi:signal transduction histidine kinase
MKYSIDAPAPRSAVRRGTGSASRRRQPLCERLATEIERQQEAILEQWIGAASRDPLLQIHGSIRGFANDWPHLRHRLCSCVRYAERTQALGMREEQDALTAAAASGWQAGERLDALARKIEILARIVLVETVTEFARVERAFRGAQEIAARTAIHRFFANLLDQAIQTSAQQQAMESQTYQAQLAIAKAELERTSAQRQRFMAVVAHELRNFVQGLSYAAQLWEKQPDNKRALLFAQTQIRDMQELLHLLLEHSTLVGARQPPSLQPFDLQALCEELAVIYEQAATQKGLRLRHECETAPELVLSDRVRVKQIVANLLSNAIKYTSRGEVCLRFRVRDEQHWEVHITDTGPGISAEHAARLLKGLGGDENLPGRGIGLGITKDLVSTLGGTIELTSANGEGSRFVVTLPGRIPIVKM